MAIEFKKEEKRQRILIYLSLLIFLITIIVLWLGFFRPPPPVRKPPPSFKRLEIDFTVLENPLLEKLEIYPALPIFEGKIGRENPFSPY